MAWGYLPFDERWTLDETTRYVTGFLERDRSVALRARTGGQRRRLVRLYWRLREAGYDVSYDKDGTLYAETYSRSPNDSLR